MIGKRVLRDMHGGARRFRASRAVGLSQPLGKCGEVRQDRDCPGRQSASPCCGVPLRICSMRAGDVRGGTERAKRLSMAQRKVRKAGRQLSDRRYGGVGVECVRQQRGARVGRPQNEHVQGLGLRTAQRHRRVKERLDARRGHGIQESSLGSGGGGPQRSQGAHIAALQWSMSRFASPSLRTNETGRGRIRPHRRIGQLTRTRAGCGRAFSSPWRGMFQG